MVDEANPTARALVCLQVLQDQPGITGDRLARHLGCSSRAARRYIAVLREAGIPVHSERGRYGGYRLGTGVRPPPLVFSPNEALGLVMAVLDGHHDAADETRPVGAAVGKLVRALPDAVAEQMEAIRSTTAAVPDRGAARPDPATTIALVRAVAQCRHVRIAYRSEAGSEWTTEVEPWAVVVRHGRWYLLCQIVPTDKVRTYRVDRIHSVVQLNADFERPPDFDPVAMLEAHLSLGWEYEVEVILDAPVDAVRARISPALGRLEALETTRTRLIATTGNPYFYAEQLASLPWAFEVIGGVELRHTVRELGRRLIAAVPGGE